MTGETIFELSPENAPLRELAGKFETAMRHPGILRDVRDSIPPEVRTSEATLRRAHNIPRFSNEGRGISRNRYADQFLSINDNYARENTRSKLQWQAVGGIPALGGDSNLPATLSARSARQVQDTLWARQRAVFLMDALGLDAGERESVIESWQNRLGMNAGMSENAIALLALRNVAQEGKTHDIDGFFNDYFWKSSLAVTSRDTEDPVNYRVAAILTALAKTGSEPMPEHEFLAILKEFGVVKGLETNPLAVELYRACVSSHSLEPLYNQNARIVGRVYLYTYFKTRVRELQQQKMEKEEAYKRTLGEMLLIATLKLSPKHPLFTQIQKIERHQLDATIDAVFNTNP